MTLFDKALGLLEYFDSTGEVIVDGHDVAALTWQAKQDRGRMRLLRDD
ncbi:MAG: hypothetical protein Q8M16_17545 [Pirellulaceae bacterium]|nr:hypothetical protein [Pirellulaceae bacterium]